MAQISVQDVCWRRTRRFAFASFGPCMLSTIISVYLVDALIAVALIKEDSTMPGAVKKYGEDESSVEDEEHVSMIEGVKWTLNSKAFRAWLIIHGCFNLGLQMFLSGQNVLISGPMGLNGF